MNYEETIKWLLEGDVSVQYQVHRDLIGSGEEVLKMLSSRIPKEGFGKQLLDEQNENGHWARGFYQPKWTSTHYTLLSLRNLCCPLTDGINKSLNIILKENKAGDGGINPHSQIQISDVCINGMFLYYACFYGAGQEQLVSVIDYLIEQQMGDGGFNCRKTRSGAVHSSLHSTLSCLEGISEYITQGYNYRKNELQVIQKQAVEFILIHRLFKSHRTGEVIHKAFTMLSYPSRWRYDILRCLDYFAKNKVPYDSRMDDALAVLIKKQNKQGTWPVQAKHVGAVYFDMEQTGKPSRWNTLRALRVLKEFDGHFSGK